MEDEAHLANTLVTKLAIDERSYSKFSGSSTRQDVAVDHQEKPSLLIKSPEDIIPLIGPDVKCIPLRYRNERMVTAGMTTCNATEPKRKWKILGAPSNMG